MRHILPILLVLYGSAAYAGPELVAYEAEYKVKFSVFGGRLTTRLSESDSGLTATHSLETTGMSRLLAKGEIEERSSFLRIATGFLPQSFETSDQLTKDKTNASFVFNHAEKLIEGTVNDIAASQPYEPPTYDRVLIQYQLMQDMLAGNMATEYRMFDIDETKQLQIENVGTTTIKSKLGKFDAIGIRHQTEGSSRSTTFWMVPELGYAPVLIEQHKDDKLRLKASLVRYTALEGPISAESQ